jgi:eukaryotic-like serine/threonine-protein kinase
MSMLSVGSVVAGYRIERVLGSGGMGAVYLAANPNLPRYDALKVLSSQLSGNPDFRARFVREADLAARLDHPNIVSIYDRGQTGEGQLWIAMQFVDGTDADKALRSGPITPGRAVHILGQAAKALDYAHQHGVVHRDIKPANLLLSGPAGPDERVLLGDFGVARALGDAGLTVTGSLLATLPYAAPEVLAGGLSDARADLYSLGCALFRMLTGREPFAAAAGMAALVAAHLHAPPPRVTDQLPGLSARMDAVIATAMAKNPAHRFSSARLLAAAAAEALTDPAMPTTVVQHPVAGTPRPCPVPMHPSGPNVGHPGAPLTTTHPPPPGYPMWPAGPSLLPRPPAAPTPRRKIAILAAVSLIVAATVVTAVTLTSRSQSSHSTVPPVSNTPAASSPATGSSATTTATVPASLLPVSALSGLLLSTQQIAGIFGVPSMIAESTSINGFTDDTPAISEKDCTGPYAPADQSAYVHTGSIGSQLQILTNPAGSNMATQAVIAFFSADAARKVFDDQRQHWAACAGRTFTVTVPNETPSRWTFGRLTTPGGNLVMTFTAQARSSAGVQRVLTVRNNIIIDVAANGLNVGDQAVVIANAIAAKMPQ